MRSFLIDRVIQKEGLNVYNMHNIVEKHFSISNAPVRSRGGLSIKVIFAYDAVITEICILVLLQS
jgi:hypothetical protein